MPPTPIPLPAPTPTPLLEDLDAPPPGPAPLRLSVSVSGGARAGAGLAARPVLGAAVGLDGPALGVLAELVATPAADVLALDGARTLSSVGLRALGTWRPLRASGVSPVVAVGAGLSARVFLDGGEAFTWGVVPELHARAGLAVAPSPWLTVEPTVGLVLDARATRVGADPAALSALPLAAADLAIALYFSPPPKPPPKNVDER